MRASDLSNRMPVSEAARMFEVCEPVFRRMVRNGDLMFLGIFQSGSVIVIPRQAVLKYFAGEKIERRDVHPIPFLHSRLRKPVAGNVMTNKEVAGRSDPT